MPNPSEQVNVYRITLSRGSYSVNRPAYATNQTIESPSSTSSVIYGGQTILTPDTSDPNKYIGVAVFRGKTIGFIIQDINTGTDYLCVPVGTTPPSSFTLFPSTGINDPNPYNWNLNPPSGPVALCFLAGTRIATPKGETAVEELQPGDMVIIMENGTKLAKPVTWVGHRSVKPGDLATDDAHPIRIKAGAFSENTPKRDLLVTAEHCIFADGGFIPARLLVNGSSIFADRTISSFTFYHIELAEHAILLAEGLPAESYLDTGNRSNFANAAVSALRPQFGEPAPRDWNNAAAPLTTRVDQVRPVWDRLNSRALALGLRPAMPVQQTLPEDADIRLVAANGSVMRPIKTAAGRYVFMVNKSAGVLRLVSNTVRPADLAPYLDDRRELGVLAGEITLHDGRRKFTANDHLSAPVLPGWFALEAPSRRWTNGDAILALPLEKLTHQSALLEIEILGACAGAIAVNGQQKAA